MNDEPGAAEWLGTPGAARYLGVSQRTLYKLADEGEVRGYKIGRVHRFKRSDLDAFLAANVIKPGDLAHLRLENQPDRNRRPRPAH